MKYKDGQIIAGNLNYDDIKEEAVALIKKAFEEDRADEDVTSLSMIPEDMESEFKLVSKDNGVLAGIDIFREAFHRFDSGIIIESSLKDGDALNYRQEVAKLRGKARSILSAERTALNFIQHLSGIAGKTAEAIEAVKDYELKVLDTRKTIPGLRSLQKYAVACGGGGNHRLDLASLILIKENHIRAAGGIKNAIKKARENNKDKLMIEIEVTSLEEVKTAFDLMPDIIMLDNMDDLKIKEAKKIVGRLVKLEVSGNVGIGRLLSLARLGVDYVSMGMLTHSVSAHDFSLLML